MVINERIMIPCENMDDHYYSPVTVQIAVKFLKTTIEAAHLCQTYTCKKAGFRFRSKGLVLLYPGTLVMWTDRLDMIPLVLNTM